MAADAIAAFVTFLAVSWVRFEADWISAWDRAGLPLLLAGATWAALWVAVLWFHGLYRYRAHWSIAADAAVVLRATALLGIMVFVLLFAARMPQISRLFLLGLFAAQLGVALLSRIAIRTFFRTARSRGHMTRYVLVVGVSSAAQEFAAMIEAQRELGLRVVGHVGELAAGDPQPRRPILGRLDDAEDVLHANVVDEVAICLPASSWALVEAVTRICAEEGKIVRIPGLQADEPMPHLNGATTEHYAGLTIQSLVYGPDRTISLLLKRLIDIVGAAVLLILLSPILVGLALAIWLRDGRPILFRQRRVGLHGRQFTVVKFRTMVRDAEALLVDLQARNEIAGAAFKLTDDPRITRIGRFLRSTSLDELPQLWNVLRGEMSLVGPRPPLPDELVGYDLWHRRRLSMKPGITGLWQVSARRHPDFDRWVSIDLDYIDRWSLWLDIKILARTFPAMLEGR